jgi:hypothetical protein
MKEERKVQRNIYKETATDNYPVGNDYGNVDMAGDLALGGNIMANQLLDSAAKSNRDFNQWLDIRNNINNRYRRCCK